jgi:Protein of unknown function (DUF3800)
MYLMYVDESGDCGLNNSRTDYFILTGLVVHESRWQASLTQLIQFRKTMRQLYGLKLREELHTYQFLNKPGDFQRIRKNDRLTIIRNFADELAKMQHLNLINIVVDKTNKHSDYDVFENAWKALIQRFENTLFLQNFPNSTLGLNEHGLILPDNTDGKKLTQLLRKMRQFNPVPTRFDLGGGYQNLRLNCIIEDPYFKDSRHSYFIQATDMSAYLLCQFLKPSSYMKKTGGKNYFQRLAPILCTVACSKNKQGIVYL